MGLLAKTGDLLGIYDQLIPMLLEQSTSEVESEVESFIDLELGRDHEGGGFRNGKDRGLCSFCRLFKGDIFTDKLDNIGFVFNFLSLVHLEVLSHERQKRGRN